MPFTFCHPAIVLPLKKLSESRLSLTGLVIGSIAPDFEYFVRMEIRGDFSHTLAGIFGFNLPVSLLLTFLFHNLVKTPLVDNLPYFLKIRFSVFKQFEWNSYFKKHWAIVIYSILIGVTSHLIWDAFTHAHGFFVERIPILEKSIAFLGFSIPAYNFLQHMSTMLGGAFIISYVYKLPEVPTEKTVRMLKYWGLWFLFTMLIASIRILAGMPLYFGNFIVTFISAGLLSLIITSQVQKK